MAILAASAGSISGRVLIAGTASLLMCLFLSPKFIEFLRDREFGQNIREEGPEGHKQKAGTPTMGGIIIVTAITIPFLVLSRRDWPSMAVFVVAGTTTAVNFADGLDGLAAGCAAIVLLAYIGITFITSGDSNLTLLSGCLVGACIGFLWFNSFPASIFMGDTGSLGLGGAIAGLAVMTQTEVILILLAGVFVLEVLSVMIQVVSFQMFRKRVFLMTPIHHHFELQGWSETKIILRFWIIAAAFAAIGFTV